MTPRMCWQETRDRAISDPRRIEVAALVGSIGLLAVGVWWLMSPAAYPFGVGDRFRDMSLLTGVNAHLAACTAVACGAVGTAVAALAVFARRWSRLLGVVTVIVAVPMAVTFGFLVPDLQILILVAYALALSLPALAVVLLVSRRTERRSGSVADAGVARRGLIAGAGTLAATLAALLALGRPWEWGRDDEGGFVVQRPLVVLGSVLLGVAWACVGVRAYRVLRDRCVRCGRPGPSWTSPQSAARWGRVLTWAAALTPLPYVVARLTWLTPWPYGESREHLAAHPGLWIFGLALAAAGELGTWLTLGLIKPRGELFPRWVPVRGGAPVPVMVAVVPGLFIALLMCVGGHSVVQQAFGPGTTWEDHTLVLLVPLPVWGPLLGAATLAYWYRRRSACPTAASPAVREAARRVPPDKMSLTRAAAEHHK
jgi:hypothetical protein